MSISMPIQCDHNPYADEQFDIIDSLDYDDVDAGLIDHELVHRQREALVHQLHASEQAYLESLNLLNKIFLQPIRKSSKQSSFNFLGVKKMICTEREIRWLFGNFDDILKIHTEILTSLEERLSIWGPTQIVSDVFQAWFPLLKKVYTTYLDNYDVSVTTYERLTRYQPFKKFVDSAHKDPVLKGATLLSLLQIPAGCVSRHAQLIAKLADATSPMHPDYGGLAKSKQQAIALFDEIRIKVEDADNVDQVLMIQQALVGAPFGVKSQRRLVLQGQLFHTPAVNAKSAKEVRTYLLFSDMLVFVRPKQEGKKTLLQYKGHIILDRARIRPLSPEETGGLQHCLEITSSFQGVDTFNSTYVGSPTVHVMQAQTAEEQQHWLNQLDFVITKLDREAAAATKCRFLFVYTHRSRFGTKKHLR
ncbi:Protein T2 [Apophysomyces ossiformis]|uniref:Protein T2 n=1 Tax=Apophysomyces ossiformis TaxID=679940 RepID=A0A8H7BL41_9FUNG|nr:Protein T2 [Apophysomyces ossiformis]